MPETAAAAGTGVFVSPIAVILLFLVLVIIALAVFLIYSAIYRRRVNRALREDAPVGPTPEPRNAGKIILIAVVAACVLWFLIWTVNQQRRLAKLEEDISSQMSEISELLDERFDQQEEALRRQNSPFADIRVECTAIYPESRTMDLTFTVVPKAVSEDTVVRMERGAVSELGYSPSLSDETDVVEMEQKYEGLFTATLNYPLFNGNTGSMWSRDLEEEGVFFELTQGGVKQTDTFSFKNTIWLNNLPGVYYDTNMENNPEETYRDAELVLIFTCPEDMSDVSLCYVNGGQVASSLDLSEYLVRHAYGATIPLRKEDFDQLSKAALDDYDCCLRFTDSYGFIHQRPIYPDFLRYDSTTFDRWTIWEKIYDADGHQLGLFKFNWKLDY